MRQPHNESNPDSPSRGKSRRIAALVATGLLTAAVGGMAVLNQPANRGHVSGDLAVSNIAETLPGAPDAATPASAVDAMRPRFERSDEPAIEETVKTYGG
jgi:hypothetical protein